MTKVLKTLKLCNHLNRLFQPLSLAILVNGIIMYPRNEKLTATRATYISNLLKNKNEINKAKIVIKKSNK